MRLSNQQRKNLKDALIDAFPTSASLEQMLSYQLNKRLKEIAGGGSLQDVVFELIQVAESQGWIKDLVCAAREANPGNQNLQIIVQELLMGSTAISSTQQQKNRRNLVVPILVAVIGAISTIAVAWINKLQSPPTTPPSASSTLPVASSPNEPSPKTSENQPPPVAQATKPGSVGAGIVETPPTFSQAAPKQPASPQAAQSYFKPCKAGTNNVIVASGYYNYKEANAKIKSLRNRFPQFRFKLWETVAANGSNDQYAVIVGHGLNQTEAQALVTEVKSAGVATDAYSHPQNWDSSPCDDLSRVER